MEIKRIGENKIRCALTEEEIRDLGFDIDDIIGNSETTQQFVRVVLGLVKEQEDIDVDNISPMIKAEILQNHSMAITFGDDAELSLKDLMDTMSHIMSQIEPKRLEELREAAKLEQEKLEQRKQEVYEVGKKIQREKAEAKKKKAEAMVCALCFSSFEDMCHMSRVCFLQKLPKSSLYKMEQKYYLVLNFAGFSKDEMRPFAFGVVEYVEAHYSELAQIARIMEQGVCIMKSEALQMLMQL